MVEYCKNLESEGFFNKKSPGFNGFNKKIPDSASLTSFLHQNSSTTSTGTVSARERKIKAPITSETEPEPTGEMFPRWVSWLAEFLYLCLQPLLKPANRIWGRKVWVYQKEKYGFYHFKAAFLLKNKKFGVVKEKFFCLVFFFRTKGASEKWLFCMKMQFLSK